MKTIIEIASAADVDAAARRFVDLMGDYTIFTFDGEMGAGKTTFISALARALGVPDQEASSPSFAIINEYRSDITAELVYHFDLYRLESLDEALDAGIEDYFDSGVLCLIEWPDRIADIIPDDAVRAFISVNADGSRSLSVVTPD